MEKKIKVGDTVYVVQEDEEMWGGWGCEREIRTVCVPYKIEAIWESEHLYRLGSGTDDIHRYPSYYRALLGKIVGKHEFYLNKEEAENKVELKNIKDRIRKLEMVDDKPFPMAISHELATEEQQSWNRIKSYCYGVLSVGITYLALSILSGLVK